MAEEKHVRRVSSSFIRAVEKAAEPTSVDSTEINSSEWLLPRYSIDGLKAMAQHSTIIPQCAVAYGANIAGFGMHLAYIEDTEETDEMIAEWDAAQSVIDLLNPDGIISDVFVEAVRERETCGIAYIEVIRNVGGEVVEISNVLDTASIKVSKKDDYATEYTRRYRGNEFTREKRFRHYVQEINGKKVYYKEFGDPRHMDRRTGEYVSDRALPIADEAANELLVLKIGKEHYGTVRWEGQILSVDGSRAAESLNCNYFHNGRHTPLMILVNNGHLTEDGKKEVASYLSSVKGEKSQFGFLLLETEPEQGKLAFSDAPEPKVEIKDLSPMLQKDALFGEYLESNRRKVQSAFRLPDVYVAYTTDYNRATVYAAMNLTEEQVFRAERESLEWVINNQLLSCYGWKHVKVVINEPDLQDQDALTAKLNAYMAGGGLPINVCKEKAFEMLGIDSAEPYEEDWGNYPLEIIKLNPGMFGLGTTRPAMEEQIATEEQEETPEDIAMEESIEEAIDKAESNNADIQTQQILRGILRELKKANRQEAGEPDAD